MIEIYSLRFWRLEFYNQGVGQTMFPLKPLREHPFLTLKTSHRPRCCLACGTITLVSALVFIWPSPFCVCISMRLHVALSVCVCVCVCVCNCTLFPKTAYQKKKPMIIFLMKMMSEHKSGFSLF